MICNNCGNKQPLVVVDLHRYHEDGRGSHPEMYKVAKALSVVLGYESFEEYISHCLRRDVNMFIQGGDEIGEYFRDAYRHLVRQPDKQRKEEVLQR